MSAPDTTEAESPCRHPDFVVDVDVSRIGENDDDADTSTPRAYTADMRIRCAVCEIPFRFVGLPVGASFYRPMSSFDGTELRAPIIPGDQLEQIEGLTGLHMIPVVQGDAPEVEG